MSRRPKLLTDEDRVLWSLIARTATPLKGKTPASVPVPETPPAAELPPTPAQTQALAALPAAPAALVKRPPSLILDVPTHQKIARGRLPIEGRVDLHGLFQDEAYALLLSFLRRAYAGGARHVLVITGKGSSSGGEGILRRAVPAWLATTPFRELVSGYDHAARGHGGAGALYIRLKRNRA